MYRKKSRGWYKHKDFILIDLVCLFMALILAYLIRNGSVRNLFTLGIYRNVMIFVILVDLFLIILFESYKGVLRRGRYQELRSVIQADDPDRTGKWSVPVYCQWRTYLFKNNPLSYGNFLCAFILLYKNNMEKTSAA